MSGRVVVQTANCASRVILCRPRKNTYIRDPTGSVDIYCTINIYDTINILVFDILIYCSCLWMLDSMTENVIDVHIFCPLKL